MLPHSREERGVRVSAWSREKRVSSARMTMTLRYFPVRGRAQPLRYLLVDHGVPFQDEFVAADASWRSIKQEPTIAGPFGVLPVLDCDGQVVGETLVIASFLSRRLGHYKARSEEEIVRMEMVSSSAYLELLTPRSSLFRPDPAPQPDAWPALFESFATRFAGRLGAFERLLANTNEPFFGGALPRAADYFVFEALHDTKDLLGPMLAPALAACPRLVALCAALAEQPSVRDYIAAGKRPVPFTASPAEPDIRARLAAYVSSRPAP